MVKKMTYEEELLYWDDKICDLAKSYNLDWHPIDYEICGYHDMIGYMAYTGLPSHYSHWSYGKSFERIHSSYNAGVEGLPYEMIINSNPSIAYLMSENPMGLQVMIMAHCIGHSDFFKNNRMFKHTDADNVLGKFRNAAKRVNSYISNPNIGIDAVERVLDSAHALKYQQNFEFSIKRKSNSEQRQDLIKKINNDTSGKYDKSMVNKFPIEPDYNILDFIADNSRNLENWEIDLLKIVSHEGSYFIPQAMTKIMNEGWASFWHYKMMMELDVPQEYKLGFLKSHNQVLRPFTGRINPYHLGFKTFIWIEENLGLEECFIARECHNDASFLRHYLNKELCQELNLFSYSKKKTKWSIDEISDDEGWKEVRDDLIQTVGLGSLPKIYIEELMDDYMLVIKHEHDGRDMDLQYAEKVCEHIIDLWGDDFKLLTVIEDELFEI